MSDLDKARTLLEAAERDLRALRGMSDPMVFADEIVGFHAQQAAEKLLKACLARGAVPVHSRYRLLATACRKTRARSGAI